MKKLCVYCIIGFKENKVRDFDIFLKYLIIKILVLVDSYIFYCL